MCIFSIKFVKTLSLVEPRLVAVSIRCLEAQKRVESMDDDCPHPPEWMHDLRTGSFQVIKDMAH